MRVLYVEDNPVDIDLLKRHLQKNHPAYRRRCRADPERGPFGAARAPVLPIRPGTDRHAAS
jgi:CheY-like chemotaxis protein